MSPRVVHLLIIAVLAGAHCRSWESLDKGLDSPGPRGLAQVAIRAHGSPVVAAARLNDGGVRLMPWDLGPRRVVVHPRPSSTYDAAPDAAGFRAIADSLSIASRPPPLA